MRVLLINNCHWRRGGSEAVYFGTGDLLRNAGHEVIYFSIEDEKNVHTGQKEYFINSSQSIGKIRDFFNNPIAARKLEEVLIKEKPDIAHAHLFWGGISPSIISVLHKHGVPLVHTAHDYRMVCPAYLLTDGKGNFCERCKGGKFYQCAIHRCSKGNAVESILMTLEMYYRNKKWHPAKIIDGFIFVSNFSRQKHVNFDKQLREVNSIVLYNCPGEQLSESFNKNIDTYNSYYLFYGRLSEEKGVQTLIHAFEKFPNLKLKIVGTGPLEYTLKRYCAENIIDNVEFCGYKSGKELFEIVGNAKYVCVPSECYENNPMTIVEAYSMGVPVIGAQIGGIPEIIVEGTTGFLFESGNVNSLDSAISRSLVNDGSIYASLKQGALDFARENFNAKTYPEKLLDFYNDVITRYRGREKKD